MASNKECMVIVLDVRSSVDIHFKEKAIATAAEILKDKICAAKKDVVSFVLVGTAETFNDVNSEMCTEGYLHIVQYPQPQLPTWQLLINFYKYIKDHNVPCEEGDWLDALVISLEILKNSQEIGKFQRHRIVLFHDFNGENNGHDMFDTITENIFKMDISLIVVSPNIMFIDNPSEGEPQPIFKSNMKTDPKRVKDERYALQLIPNCNAQLCNLNEALPYILRTVNRKPWTWNSQLTIGSKITLNISGVIAIKDESNIKLQKAYAEQGETTNRELKYFHKNEEITPLDVDLMEAYMLGATPIPYEDALKERASTNVGLRLIAFTKRESIPQEYYCGDSLYWVVHQKGMTASAKKLDALVKALINTNMVMLCWKVFSEKFNRSRFVVLLPNKLSDDKSASLSMIELSYHEQHHYWDFPSLETAKTKCTEQQIDAMNNLIDAMNLTPYEIKPGKPQEPRKTHQKDMLPYDSLPHIYEQNIMDVLERKVLRNVPDDDKLFEEMLTEKNFAEVFWKLPEDIEEKAKRAARKVKDTFPLEKNTLVLKNEPAFNINKREVKDTLSESISQENPAEDFKNFICQIDYQTDDVNLKKNIYEKYAEEMRNVITKSLENHNFDSEKLSQALFTYRESCSSYFEEITYNKFIEQVKDIVKANKLFDFWKEHVVDKHLGYLHNAENAIDEASIQQLYSLDDENKQILEAADDIEKQFSKDGFEKEAAESST